MHEKTNNQPTALVTGAYGGIGKSICEVFFEAGYRVIGACLHDPVVVR